MTLANDFTIVSTSSNHAITPAYEDATSAKTSDIDIQITTALRTLYPDLTLTITTAGNVPLLYFANLGFATAELDTTDETVFRWRRYYGPQHRGGPVGVGDATFFAKYHYKWAGEDFIIYTIVMGYSTVQYVLKEPGPGEDPLSHCGKTDALMIAVVQELTPDEAKYIWVYDGYWYRSQQLWEEVQKASWHDVILDPKTKDALTKVSKNFFDSREQYEKYGVAWKRGLIFYGPPGNGKTVSLKALMHTLYQRKPVIQTLYVKSASSSYSIGSVFAHARRNAPCLLIMEDIETIVKKDTRSYFFNEVDGLASNDGILMLASTNYLNKLDPGLTKRPSRFDRKYLFPLPDRDEREQYAEYWRKKIASRSDEIDFPQKLCPAIAGITDLFSFAYIQEAFIATLLAIARGDEDDGAAGSEIDDAHKGHDAVGQHLHAAYERLGISNRYKDPLDEYKFWRVMRTQVSILRADMDSGSGDGNGDEGNKGRDAALSRDAGGNDAMEAQPPQMASTGRPHEWKAAGLPILDPRIGQHESMMSNNPKVELLSERDSQKYGHGSSADIQAQGIQRGHMFAHAGVDW